MLHELWITEKWVEYGESKSNKCYMHYYITEMWVEYGRANQQMLTWIMILVKCRKNMGRASEQMLHEIWYQNMGWASQTNWNRYQRKIPLDILNIFFFTLLS